MTREEAASILHNAELPEKWLHNGNYSDVLEAFNFAIDYLRGPQWIKTADRLPKKKDYPIATYGGEGMIYEFDYWLPLPPVPEEGGYVCINKGTFNKFRG